MKKTRRIVSALLAIALVLGTFCISAAAKQPPVSLCVTVDRDECGYLGVINVTITVRNNSCDDVKNVVVTSSDSEGLVTYRPVVKNVAITNPGALPLRKSDAMTTCLKPGGMLRYSYCVLLGYQYAFRNIPESTSILMKNQHLLLKARQFKTISIGSGKCVNSSIPLSFCDLSAVLDVKAYYDIKDRTYDSVASGNTVSETRAESSRSASSGGNSRAIIAVTNESSSVSDNNATSTNNGNGYVLNIDSDNMMIHRPSCYTVKMMNEENKKYTNESITELERQGYQRCSKCNPT